MTIVKVPETVLEYRFDRLDYIAVEDYTDSYIDDDEVKTDNYFVVVAWGLDTDNVLPWENQQISGRFVSWHDTKEDANEAATKLADELGVPVHIME